MNQLQEEKSSIEYNRAGRRTVVETLQIKYRTPHQLSILFMDLMVIMLFSAFSLSQTTDAQEPISALSGQFVGAGDGIHNAEGMAREISLEDGKQFIYK